MIDAYAQYVVRAATFLVWTAFLAVLFMGCSGLRTASLSASVTPEDIILRGSANGTWIQTPHGGPDEKSNSAPIPPSEVNSEAGT